MKCDIDDIFDFKFPNLHIKYYWEKKINDTEQWNKSTCSNLFLPNPTIGQTSLRPKSLNAWKVKKIIIAKINNGGNGVKKDISSIHLHTTPHQIKPLHFIPFTSFYSTHSLLHPYAFRLLQSTLQ